MKKQMSKTEMRRKNRARQVRFSEKKRALGEIKKSVWLAPDEVEFFNLLFSKHKNMFRGTMKYALSCIENGEKFRPLDFMEED